MDLDWTGICTGIGIIFELRTLAIYALTQQACSAIKTQPWPAILLKFQIKLATKS